MSKNSFTQAVPLTADQQWHLELIDECRGDPALFGMTFFKETAFPAPFSQIHSDLITAYLDDSLEKVMCLAPRFHGKSTIGAFLLPLHAALYHPQVVNKGLQVIISQSEVFAIDRLNTIKMEIDDNEHLNTIYGGLKGKKWKELQFEISGKDLGVRSTMLARGWEQDFQGVKKGHRRPFFIWGDDMEKRSECKNPDLVKKNLVSMDSVIERALDKINRGRLFCVATMMAEGSMTHVLTQRESWYTMMYSCMKSDGSMIWPEGYSSEDFARDYKEAELEDRLDGFWLEMMNTPHNPDKKELRMEHVKYYSPQDLDQESEQKVLMHNYILIDPSFSSEKDSDVTGISVVGVNDLGHYFIHDAIYSSAKEPVAITNEIIPLILKYEPVSVHVESFGAQNMLPGLIRRFLQEEKIHTPVYGMRGSHSKGAKAARIRTFISKIKGGKVFFCSEGRAIKRMIRDFLAFPHKLLGGDYDVIDSVSYAPIVTIRPKVVRTQHTETFWEYQVRRRAEIVRDSIKGQRDGRI